MNFLSYLKNDNVIQRHCESNKLILLVQGTLLKNIRNCLHNFICIGKVSNSIINELEFLTYTPNIYDYKSEGYS